MKYSIKQLNEFMRRIQENEEMIRIDRGLRYGAPDDTLSNVAEFGADGAIVAFWECARRIRNMYGKEKDLADLENAVMDGRNYLAYILCLETRELGQGEYNIPPKPSEVIYFETKKEMEEFTKEQIDPKPKVVPWKSVKGDGGVAK